MPDNTRMLATELQDLALRKRHLQFKTALALLGVLITAVTDFGMVGYATRERFLDPFRNFTGEPWMLVATSAFSIFIYWFIGAFWKQGRRKLAVALYAFVLAVMVDLLWPGESARSQELWAAAHDTTVFDAGGAPLWFIVPRVLLWSGVFTVGGLGFVACKRFLESCLAQWRAWSVGGAKRLQFDRADAAADDLDALTNWIAHVETNFHALGRHMFRVALDQETAAVTARRDDCLRRAREVTASAVDQAAARAEADKLTLWLKATLTDEDEMAAAPDGSGEQSLRPIVNALFLVAALGPLSAVPARAQSSLDESACPLTAALAAQARDNATTSCPLDCLLTAGGLLLCAASLRQSRRAWAALRETPKPEDGGPAIGIDAAKKTSGNAARTGVVVLAGVLVSGLPARAQSSAELCAVAPTLQIALDQSSSSPLRHPAFVEHVAAEILPKIGRLPMCAKVIAFTFGDGRVLPTMYSSTVLARRVRGTGSTKDDIARSIRQLLASMPAAIKERPQERSEILGAFADMARNLNPRARGNAIVMVSDGAESSVYADCERRRDCKLPSPPFSLKGVDVAFWGIGEGMDAGRAAAISKTFEAWFKQAGLEMKTYKMVRF